MGEVKPKKRRFHYRGILAIAFVFMVIAAVLLVELSGIRAHYASSHLAYLPENKVITKAEAIRSQPQSTLVFWNSSEPDTARFSNSPFSRSQPSPALRLRISGCAP